MAVGVVDFFEPVKVQEQDRGDLSRASARAKRVLEQLQHQEPVRQPGQWIVQRRLRDRSEESSRSARA